MQYIPNQDEILELYEALKIDDPFARGNAIDAWFYNPETNFIRVTPRTVLLLIEYIRFQIQRAQVLNSMEAFKLRPVDANAFANLNRMWERFNYYLAKTQAMAEVTGLDRVAGMKDDVGSPIGLWFLDVANPLIGLVPNNFPNDPAWGNDAGEPINLPDFQRAIIEANVIRDLDDARDQALDQLTTELYENAAKIASEVKETVKKTFTFTGPIVAAAIGLFVFSELRK